MNLIACCLLRLARGSLWRGLWKIITKIQTCEIMLFHNFAKHLTFGLVQTSITCNKNMNWKKASSKQGLHRAYQRPIAFYGAEPSRVTQCCTERFSLLLSQKPLAWKFHWIPLVLLHKRNKVPYSSSQHNLTVFWSSARILWTQTKKQGLRRK